MSCPYIPLDDLDTQKKVGSTVRTAADITIMTSAHEAYGMVAAEALAYASIPVVPAVGGLVDIIKPMKPHEHGSFKLEWHFIQTSSQFTDLFNCHK